ncbi:radical SAM protein [Blastomonas sp.]|uniref:radical SAM protein n=1 Tax=Blastomonas sp. TaxID=1909299 RepID=UPI00261BB4D8|nr:radical SAM protein [Blastomonas sp.]MDM7955041.1 radical SAM protein [Blastomonas sp.]
MDSTSPFAVADAPPLDPAKFRDPLITAKGERRASVAMTALETLWFNTGTLCNLACKSCYIESSPRNDALVYLTLAEVTAYLDEIAASGLPTREIAFTGGEPFMNPDIIAILELCLSRGFATLVLSNAMRPMRRHEDALLAMNARFSHQLTIRVSLDHYTQDVHEAERGGNSWDKAISGLTWLAENGFAIAVAGRHLAHESDAQARAGFAALFARHGLPIRVNDPQSFVMFPEMDAEADIAEISTGCWDILGKSPDAMMCATSRMVVKHKGAERPTVAACTLLPYDPQFDMGATLGEASRSVSLNHPHCARFCVLGGASCS